MALMDRTPKSPPPQKHYELVLVDYTGNKTRSAAIVILTYFCRVSDSHASFCFDGLPDLKEILVISKDKSDLIRKKESLGFYGFVVDIREEVCS